MGLEALVESYAFWRPSLRTLTFEDIPGMAKQGRDNHQLEGAGLTIYSTTSVLCPNSNTRRVLSRLTSNFTNSYVKLQ